MFWRSSDAHVEPRLAGATKAAHGARPEAATKAGGPCARTLWARPGRLTAGGGDLRCSALSIASRRLALENRLHAALRAAKLTHHASHNFQTQQRNTHTPASCPAALQNSTVRRIL